MAAFFAFLSLQFCLTFLVLSPATPCHAPCSCHLSTSARLSCLPDLCSLCSLPLEYLSTCQNSTHLSRPSSNVTSSVSFLSICLHSTLPHQNAHSFLSSHSALTLCHSTLYILPCLSSSRDSESFILIFTSSSTVPGMNSWNQKGRREKRGHVLPCHAQ